MLIVFEGIDGSGKSSQVSLLEDYLEENNFAYLCTAWGGSKAFGDACAAVKKRKQFDPLTYALANAADLVQRVRKKVMPALAENQVVVCDRFCYTSYARDLPRGIAKSFLDTLYAGLPAADAIFYLDVTPETALARTIKNDNLNYANSGMDLDLSGTGDKEAAFLGFVAAQQQIYQSFPADGDPWVRLDAERDNADVLHQQVMQTLQARGLASGQQEEV